MNWIGWVVGLVGLLVIGLVIAAIAAGVGAIWRWARRTGRRPWLWMLITYAVANVLWGIASAMLGVGR